MLILNNFNIEIVFVSEMSPLYKVNGLKLSENKFTLLNKTFEEELGSPEVHSLTSWTDVTFDEHNRLNYLCNSCQRNQYAFAQLSLNKEAEMDVLNNHGQEPLCIDRNHKPSDIIEFVLVDAENGNSYDNMHCGSCPSQSVSMNGHITASFEQMDRRAYVERIPIQSPMFCMS